MKNLITSAAEKEVYSMNVRTNAGLTLFWFSAGVFIAALNLSSTKTQRKIRALE